MSLKTKWIGLIYEAATGSRKIRIFLTPIVGLSYFLFASLFVIAAFLIDRLFHFPQFPSAPIHFYLSILFIISGLSLAFWCVFHFVRIKGTPVPFNPPPVLVTSGPYAYIRNPMLSGVFIFLFGLGTAFQSIGLIFIFTPLFILVNVMELKAIEEPELEMRLGQEYVNYKKRTPMFLPKIG
ncbi:MAG: hypothetical protein CVU71_05845 [Deltaproteobacteria bacterium HGW-Deltaproteobacteria-6]|jgi:protein-S-isoprenylcysteine O-methyltransferase Ste14|nr:MAG: hypothetical protein CVU71_05845 [Deltaproteobacteria bacterium HGW-Deltaproteobacteria-6]